MNIINKISTKFLNTTNLNYIITDRSKFYFLMKENDEKKINKYFNNIDLQDQIKIIYNYINLFYKSEESNNPDNFIILDNISNLLETKINILLQINNNNYSIVDDCLDIENNYQIIIDNINNITNIDHQILKPGYFPYKWNYLIKDLLKIGKYKQALDFFNHKHIYGKCCFRCGCGENLIKLKKWNEIIMFYNKNNYELEQTFDFIKLVDIIKNDNLASNKQLLEMSELIKDKINKEIFLKKINGENITPAYKYGMVFCYNLL
jgi:hypothetical protein